MIMIIEKIAKMWKSLDFRGTLSNYGNSIQKVADMLKSLVFRLHTFKLPRKS